MGGTMGYKAVALSQVDGAGGESIGIEVAQKLGFGYLNEGIVAQVATDQRLDPAVVADAERRRSFLDKVASLAAHGGGQGVTVETWPNPLDDPDKVLPLIREAVQDAAARGNVVLVAHAASYACSEQPDVLRVGITAPMATRVSRVAAAHGISEKDAAKSVKKSDAGRAAYLKKTYGISSESPSDYDVIINTERLTPDAAVELIVALAQTS
jgi:Cytidylate kinase-like family